MNFNSPTFSRLQSCAFAARMAGTDAISFDSDSFDIAMDNCASRTMTFNQADFITPLRTPDVSSIIGAGCSAPVQGMDDVSYLVTDDNGVQHEMIVKDAYYVPSVPFRLLAVNQYAKQIEANPGSEGTGIFSFG